jgi:hypothetical protein
VASKHPKELQEKMISLFRSGKSAASIGRQLGLFTTSVTRVLRRNGLTMRECRGENHGSWKGGMVVKNGYPMKYMPDHPRRLNIPYVPMHVLEIEKAIGRVPRRDEPIHHVDLDKMNYKLPNLYLCKSHSEHAQIHAELDRLVALLIRNGTVRFKDGHYYLPEHDHGTPA